VNEMSDISEAVDWIKPVSWIKSVFEKAGVSKEEIQVVLPRFASFSYSELEATIITGLNCILLSEEENIGCLTREVRVTRIILKKACDNEDFHRVYKSFIDFLLKFFHETDSTKESIKENLFFVPVQDHSLVVPLLFLFEKCLELASCTPDEELDKIIEIGMNLPGLDRGISV